MAVFIDKYADCDYLPLRGEGGGMCYGGKHLPLVGPKQKKRRDAAFSVLKTVATGVVLTLFVAVGWPVQALQYQPAQ